MEQSTTPEAVARIRALLAEVTAILTSPSMAEEPGGHMRASLLPDIDFLHDLAAAADPRRIVDGADDGR